MKARMFKPMLAAAFLLVVGSMQAQIKKGPAWLGDAVFYEIYPSTFMDSNGDGIGDLPGITSKLDYVRSLGVNAIWLNPTYESAWNDGGYDIINYYKVDPRFGTNTDMVNLIAKAHSLGIKVLLDLVPGHTSDRCQWFQESMREDPNSHYSDYYIWSDSLPQKDLDDIALRAKDSDPASSGIGDWVEADAPRARYYRKNYFPSQPALNYGFANPDPNKPWEQPTTAPGPQAVRREIRSIMAFWFDKGIDGFRVDLPSTCIKGDNDRSASRQLWREMRQWMDANYPDRMLVSEWGHPEMALPMGFNADFYFHFNDKGFSTLFFSKTSPSGFVEVVDHPYFDRKGRGEVKTFADEYTKEHRKTVNVGYIALPTANHDMQRLSYGERTTPQELKVAMTFFLTMPGVPFIYYGDEIGMRYLPDLPNKEGARARAGSRTPMQWAPGLTAGFSTCAPGSLYLPIYTDNGRLTVASQEADKGSLLNYVRQLTALRHATPALNNNGEWTFLSSTDKPYPMVYSRTDGSDVYIVALNPTEKAVSATIDSQSQGKPQSVIVSGKAKYKAGKKGDVISLGPCSAAVYKVR